MDTHSQEDDAEPEREPERDPDWECVGEDPSGQCEPFYRYNGDDL